MKKIAFALSGVLAVSTAAYAVTTAQTNTVSIPQNKNTPVLLVHGFMTYDAASIDCQSLWGPMLKELAAQGYTNVKTVTYYKDSTHCDVNLATMYPNVGRDNTWKELGAGLSRYIYDHYSQYGQSVDLLGHSMGGLVIRSAVQGGQEGLDGFKPTLVEDAVTIATPHKGTSFASLCIHTQCKALSPTNPDFTWLASQPNPQSMIATDWSVQASNLDSLTNIDSGLAMGVDPLHKKVFSGLTHNGQLSNNASVSHAATSLGTLAQ